MKEKKDACCFTLQRGENKNREDVKVTASGVFGVFSEGGGIPSDPQILLESSWAQHFNKALLTLSNLSLTPPALSSTPKEY